MFLAIIDKTMRRVDLCQPIFLDVIQKRGSESFTLQRWTPLPSATDVHRVTPNTPNGLAAHVVRSVLGAVADQVLDDRECDRFDLVYGNQLTLDGEAQGTRPHIQATRFLRGTFCIQLRPHMLLLIRPAPFPLYRNAEGVNNKSRGRGPTTPSIAGVVIDMVPTNVPMLIVSRWQHTLRIQARSRFFFIPSALPSAMVSFE